MKLLIVIGILVFALANAEPAGYSSSYNSAKNTDPDFEIQQVEVIEIPWQEESAASPPDSYTPPQQEPSPPKQEYGPPQQEYGPPKEEYGPPKPVYGPPAEVTTTESDMTTTTEYPTTTEVSTNSTSNNSTSNNGTSTNISRIAKLQEDLTERGVYYVYHPTGVLQRVDYSAKDDVKNMAYSTQLKYQNVEPINGPIYTYDPATYLFRRINK